MSIKSSKKIGFFASLAMLIGSVVGIGIFFKSHSILRTNDWSGIGTLISWIIGGLLSLTAAISFSEIGSIKTNKVHGLAGWSERVGGKRLGYFVRFNYSFFYFGLLTAVLGVFCSEMVFNLISTFGANVKFSDFPIYAHILLGLFFSTSFTLLNYFSIKTGGHIQIVTTILKWIPLVVVGFSGVILATTNNIPTAGTWKTGSPFFGHNAFDNGSTFQFTAMLAALPAVLFAFDAFINVASMRKKMEHPDKLPTVVTFGMLSVFVLYILIALAAILHGSGMVSELPFTGVGEKGAGYGIFEQIFDHKTAIAMGKFVVVFLLISTFGVMNGISAVGIVVHEQAIETNTIFGSKSLVKKYGVHKTVLAYSSILLVFWTIVFGIPAILLNSDSIIDGLSNFPTLFFFGVYGLVILLYTLKRNKFETNKIHKIFFQVTSWISIIGISFVVIYMLTYGFFIGPILDPDTTNHWGLYAGDNGDYLTDPNKFGRYTTQLDGLILFFVMLSVFFYGPTINWLLSKKFENNNVIIETQKTIESKN